MRKQPLAWNNELLNRKWQSAIKKYEHTEENEVTVPERMVCLDHPKKERLVTGMFYKYSLILPLLPPSGRVLDACAGSGFGASLLAESGYDVTAMDPTLTWAKYRDNITLAETNILDFEPENGELFDGITMIDAIEHLKAGTQIAALQNMYKWLKPGGWFLIDTPRVETSGYQSMYHPSCLNWDDLLVRVQAAGEWSEYQRYLLSFEYPLCRGGGFTVCQRILQDEEPEWAKGKHGQDQIIIARKA